MAAITAKKNAVRPSYRDLHPDHSYIMDRAEVDAYMKVQDKLRMEPHDWDEDSGRKKLIQSDYFGKLGRAREAGERLEKFAQADQAFKVARAISGTAFEPTVTLAGFLAAEFASAVAAQSVLPAILGFADPPPFGQNVEVPGFSTLGGGAYLAEGGAVSATDPGTFLSTHPVVSFGANLDAARQLYERVPPAGLDEVFTRALAERYAAVVDSQIISGTGSPGLTGLDAISGALVVTDNSSTTQAQLLVSIAKLVSQTASAIGRKEGLALILHPRRYLWLISGPDGAARPLVNPDPDASTTEAGGPGAVGTILSVPTYLSLNIPTTLNANTDADEIICVHKDRSCHLTLGRPQVSVGGDVLSGNLRIRLSARAYSSFGPVRQGAGIGVLSGSASALRANSGF